MSLIVTTPDEAVKYALEIGYCPELKIIRDKEGQWAHPVISAYLEKYNHGDKAHTASEHDFLLRSHFGISIKRLNLEDDNLLNENEILEYQNNLHKWQPAPPQGYFLARLMQWEDGAVANFIKHHEVVTPYSDLRLVEIFEERLADKLGRPLDDLKAEFNRNDLLYGKRYGADKHYLTEFNQFRKSFFVALENLGIKDALEQYVYDYLNFNSKDTFLKD